MFQGHLFENILECGHSLSQLEWNDLMESMGAYAFAQQIRRFLANPCCVGDAYEGSPSFVTATMLEPIARMYRWGVVVPEEAPPYFVAVAAIARAARLVAGR